MNKIIVASSISLDSLKDALYQVEELQIEDEREIVWFLEHLKHIVSKLEARLNKGQNNG